MVIVCGEILSPPLTLVLCTFKLKKVCVGSDPILSQKDCYLAFSYQLMKLEDA